AVSSRGIEGAPTLAVEILSAWTASIDRQRKRQLYARYGVPFYWIVDPDARAVEAHVLGPEGYAQVERARGEGRAALRAPGDPGAETGELRHRHRDLVVPVRVRVRYDLERLRRRRRHVRIIARGLSDS